MFHPIPVIVCAIVLCHISLAAYAPEASCFDSNVGSIRAKEGDFPYHVSVRYKLKHWCSGALIRPGAVVTTAYCTYRLNATSLKVVLGTVSQRGWGVSIDVVEIAQHPLYNYITSDYDVSLLKLRSAAPFSNTIRPVRFAEQFVGPKSLSLVTSWSQRREPSGERYEFLQQSYAPFVNVSMCLMYYPFGLTNRIFCAGYLTGGRESCFADRGSPVVINNKLLGLYSWGDGCARPGFPGVYTSINSVLQFINSIAY